MAWHEVHTRYTRNEYQLAPECIDRLLGQFPLFYQLRVGRFHRWQDAQATLLGRLLVDRTIREVSTIAPNWASLAVSGYQRPFFPECPGLDFNISHTKGLVACTVCYGHSRVGIDVERHEQVRIADFHRVFTPHELTHLRLSPRPVVEFYRLWTRKEAVMKADGRGFYLNAATIDCLAQPVIIDEQPYQVSSLEVGSGYTAHLATVRNVSPVHREVPLSDLVGT